MNKNILFVVHNLKIGGIQKITLDTARYHVLQGNQVSILLLENKIELDVDFECNINSINLYKELSLKPWLALYYWFYKVLLRKIFPQSEFYWSQFIYTKILNKFIELKGIFDAVFINGARTMHRFHAVNNDKIVYSLHLPHVLTQRSNTYYNFLFKKLFSNKKVFTVSDFIRKPLKDKASRLNVKFTALETIYNPCDIEKITSLANETIDFNEPYVLGVGRLTKQKRFDRLISAYHKSGIKKKLIILGEGNQRKALEEQIKELNLEHKVILKGFDLNPYKWMRNADFFILSSDVEGFVLVINEALACGTPVIATDCGPVTEILSGKLKTGISKKNSDDLASKIQQFVKTPVYPPPDSIQQLTFPTIIKKQMAMANLRFK